MGKITLTQGKHALVDDEDFERVNQYTWCANSVGSNFYAYRKSGNKTILMHRFIMNVTDPNIIVDHKYHDTLDNRKLGLRLCTKTENNRNKSPHKNSSSQYLGVSWDKARNKWLACIYVNSKYMYLGRYENEKDAAIAYDSASLKHFKEFANLNFK